MKIEKFDSKQNVTRIVIANGEMGDKKFSFSLLVDGSSFVVEFEEDAYQIKTTEILAEILKHVGALDK